MKISYELDLASFQAWSGARDTLDRVINEDMCEELENILEELYPDGMTETELNDFLWFEPKRIFEWLGIDDGEEEEEEEDEDEDEGEEIDMPEGWEPSRSVLIDGQWYCHVPVSMD